MDVRRLGDELHDISKMRSNLICTRIRMPGLKNQIRIPRIILTLVQWSSKPNDESCPRAVESAPYRGFVGIRGSIWLCLVYLNIYCGPYGAYSPSVLRIMRHDVELAIYITALQSRLRNIIDSSNKPTDALPVPRAGILVSF